MNVGRILKLYEEYARKRWFPDIYADPYGELIDFLDEETLDALAKSGQSSALALANVLSSLLPPIRFPDLYMEVKQAYAKRINGTTPPFAYYHIRRGAPEIWNELE